MRARGEIASASSGLMQISILRPLPTDSGYALYWCSHHLPMLIRFSESERLRPRRMESLHSSFADRRCCDNRAPMRLGSLRSELAETHGNRTHPRYRIRHRTTVLKTARGTSP